MRKSQPRNAGFTLVELVAAVSIFLVLAAGLGASLLAGMQLKGETRERDIAREAARAQLETIRASISFANLTDLDKATFTDGLDSPLLDGAVGTISVDDTNPELLVVRIHITWNGIHGSNSFELSTLIANTNP